MTWEDDPPWLSYNHYNNSRLMGILVPAHAGFFEMNRKGKQQFYPIMGIPESRTYLHLSKVESAPGLSIIRRFYRSLHV